VPHPFVLALYLEVIFAVPLSPVAVLCKRLPESLSFQHIAQQDCPLLGRRWVGVQQRSQRKRRRHPFGAAALSAGPAGPVVGSKVAGASGASCPLAGLTAARSRKKAPAAPADGGGVPSGPSVGRRCWRKAGKKAGRKAGRKGPLNFLEESRCRPSRSGGAEALGAHLRVGGANAGGVVVGMEAAGDCEGLGATPRPSEGGQ